MTNKEVSKILAERCVKVNKNKLYFAIQLFVEEVVLDDTISCYDERLMENKILEYLNDRVDFNDKT
jgi:hypothetical protein